MYLLCFVVITYVCMYSVRIMHVCTYSVMVHYLLVMGMFVGQTQMVMGTLMQSWNVMINTVKRYGYMRICIYPHNLQLSCTYFSIGCMPWNLQY